ncbi:hypothetical protein [Emticicia fontis]
MKATTLLILTFLQLSCIDTRPVFSIKERYPRDEVIATHKKIAILPVNFVENSEDALDKIINKNTDPLTRQEEKAYKYQQLIFEELYRANRNTDWLTDKATNRILKEKSISFQDLSKLSKPEIAKQLQVDAVIYFDFLFKTEIETNKPLSANGNDKKNVVEITVEIYSAQEDDLIWRGQSTVNRQRIYSPTLFKELIGRQLEPVLPFN